MNDPSSSPRVSDLLKRARAGDAAALDEAIVAFRTRLTRFAAKSLHGRNAPAVTSASEMVQKMELKAAGRFITFRGKTTESWRCWLEMILKRIMWRAAAPRGVDKRRVSLDDCASVLADRHRTPVAETLAKETNEQVIRAFRTLLPGDQRILSLRLQAFNFDDTDDTGLSFDEIGKVLGIKSNAASMRYRRAIKRLAAELERGGFTL